MKQEYSDSQIINQDLLKLFKLFRRKLRMLFWFTALGLLISGAYGFYMIPTRYSADVLLYIWQDKAESETEALTVGDLNLFSQLVYDYQTLVKSRLVTRQVAEELKMTPAQYAGLPGKISVDTKEDTRHITISVIDEDPRSAAVIANTIAKYFSQAVVEKMGAANVQIIDPAVVPDGPVSRGIKTIIAIGGLVGLMLGIGLVLMKSSLDTTIRTVGEVKSLTDLALLGLIHEYEMTPVTGEGAFTFDRDNQKTPRYNADLITRHDQLTATSEAFKATRTNIEFSVVDRKIHSMMVTSTQQDEGKTVTLANLAITYAQMGRRVLLVDADLHSPTVHDYFGVLNRGGLTSILTGAGHFSEFVRPTLTDNLSILTSGPIPSNPADLLISQTMSDLIKDLTDQYELVLIDCPPIGIVADASIVATKVDATLFVVRSGVTNRFLLNRAISILDQVHASILGFIMNGVNKNSDDYHYADGRFIRHMHERKAGSAESHSMMKAAPLVRQPSVSTDVTGILQPADPLTRKTGNGSHQEKNQDWRG